MNVRITQSCLKYPSWTGPLNKLTHKEDSDTDELVEENTNEPEIQQENMLQEDDQQSEDEQQPAAAAQDEVSASPHPDSDEEERELATERKMSSKDLHL